MSILKDSEGLCVPVPLRGKTTFYRAAALWPAMRKSSYLPALNSVLCILIIFVCLSLFLTRGLGLYAARATGESMLPAIPEDALIVLSSRQPEIGDERILGRAVLGTGVQTTKAAVALLVVEDSPQ